MKNSEIYHDRLRVFGNIASVGGGVCVRDSNVLPMEQYNGDAKEKTSLTFLQQTSAPSSPVSKVHRGSPLEIVDNVAVRAYPFVRNVIDKDGNSRKPLYGGEGGALALNVWTPNPTTCVSDGKPECTPRQVGTGGASSIVHAVISTGSAHTRGGGVSIGTGHATMIQVDVYESHSLFGGSVGLHERAKVVLLDSTFSHGRATVALFGEEVSDDQACKRVGGYGGLFYFAEGVEVQHKALRLSDGIATRAGGGVAFGPSWMCLAYKNASAVHGRQPKAIFVEKGDEGMNNASIIQNCEVDPDLDIQSGGMSEMDLQSPELGGALYSLNGYDFQVGGMEITNCKAWRGGAMFVSMPAKAEVSRVIFHENDAREYGGACEVEEGARLVLDHTLFTGNKARSGGALAVVTQRSETTTISMSQSELRGNRALAGGGVYLTLNPTMQLSIDESVFDDNTAIDAGGGAICALGGPSCAGSPCVFNVDRSQFHDNRAPKGEGGAILLEKADSRISRSKFSGSAMSSQEGLSCKEVRQREAMGLLASGQSSQVECGKRRLNARSGGAIAAKSSQSELVMVGCTLTDLLADFGAGIFLDKAASAFLEACSFNTSEAKFGGALELVQDSKLLANATTFANNMATVGGGAIHMERSTATLEDCLSKNNFANSQGGAIYAGKRSLLQGHRNVYFENEAMEEAGALFVGQASWWHSAEPFFWRNRAGTAGGAVYVTDGNLTTIVGTVLPGKSASFEKARHGPGNNFHNRRLAGVVAGDRFSRSSPRRVDNDGTLLRPRSLAETLASSWEWYHEKHNKADRAALFRGDLQHDAVVDAEPRRICTPSPSPLQNAWP